MGCTTRTALSGALTLYCFRASSSEMDTIVNRINSQASNFNGWWDLEDLIDYLRTQGSTYEDFIFTAWDDKLAVWEI